MCEWGKTEQMKLTVAKHLSHTGQERAKLIDVDSCIASLIKALNDGGAATTQSCCGHGKCCGQIDLADGRVLRVSSPTATECSNCATLQADLEREIAAYSKLDERCHDEYERARVAEQALTLALEAIKLIEHKADQHLNFGQYTKEQILGVILKVSRERLLATATANQPTEGQG